MNRRLFPSKTAFVFAALFNLTTPMSSFSAETPAYKNPQLAVDQRVTDLLGRMTLEEKVAQMTCLWLQKPNDNTGIPQAQLPFGGKFSPERAAVAMPHGVGQFARQREFLSPRESAEYANAVQQWARDHTRLGIPVVFHDEILHGNMSSGSTVFPVPLALASSWDPVLIQRVFAVAARHTRLRGTHQVLGPNMDLAREPRWGRTEETYGEDPFLVSQLVETLVKTIQGGATYDSERLDEFAVIATGKHFAGHGQPEAGTNTAPINLSERLLRETHFVPFENAVKRAHLLSIMPAYHEIDGVPVHANAWMLDTVLRREWGFRGTVASDYRAMPELHELHAIAKDKAEAARLALAAGLDIELPDAEVNATLVEQVRAGAIPLSQIDQAVARLLKQKFQLGLFENPFVDPELAAREVDSAADRELAAEAARRSIVLLKNDGGLLPLDRSKIKAIAVIGPNAERAHLGGYTDQRPPRSVSLLEGIRNKVGSSLAVHYAKGVVITREDGNWWADTSTPGDEATDRQLIAEAVELAKRCDVVVLSIGGNEDTNKEAWAKNHLGDRDSLELFGRQNELVSAVLATGKPVVAFLTNGGPLAINDVAKNVPAILEGFYLGEETGTAAADVLFGDYNPSGKLAVSFPRSAGQLPIYYNRKPTAKRGYVFSTTEPLFPFGYGLSYTTFAYGDPALSATTIRKGENAAVSVVVTNTGKVRGDEIVQLYLRDKISSVTRPVKELKGFQRVSLAPGESCNVTFAVTHEALAFYNLRMERVVEPGDFDLMVGPSSADVKTVTLTVTE